MSETLEIAWKEKKVAGYGMLRLTEHHWAWILNALGAVADLSIRRLITRIIQIYLWQFLSIAIISQYLG